MDYLAGTIFVTGILKRRAAAQTVANEPDVFASPEADLDPESDTGEPEGWN